MTNYYKMSNKYGFVYKSYNEYQTLYYKHRARRYIKKLTKFNEIGLKFEKRTIIIIFD